MVLMLWPCNIKLLVMAIAAHTVRLSWSSSSRHDTASFSCEEAVQRVRVGQHICVESGHVVDEGEVDVEVEVKICSRAQSLAVAG